MKNWVLARLAALLAVGSAASAEAQVRTPPPSPPSPPSPPTASPQPGPRRPAPPPEPRPCDYVLEITGPTGGVTRLHTYGMGASGGEIFLRPYFKGVAFPDPELVQASRDVPTVRMGDLFVTARQGTASDLRREKAGDPRPIYMREAPVLKVGNGWFVGDRIDFQEGGVFIMLTVDAEFIDAYRDTLAFEIWWKGARRLAFKAIPDNLTPDGFRAKCLTLPAEIRERTKPGESSQTMRKLAPSPTPRFLDYRGWSSATNLRSNPFSYSERSPGSAAFRITVGRDGLVKQCDLIAQTGKVPPRPEACEEVRERTRFYPATDATGAPVEAEMRFDMDWTPSAS